STKAISSRDGASPEIPSASRAARVPASRLPGPLALGLLLQIREACLEHVGDELHRRIVVLSRRRIVRRVLAREVGRPPDDGRTLLLPRLHDERRRVVRQWQRGLNDSVVIDVHPFVEGQQLLSESRTVLDGQSAYSVRLV